jgi:hypothetical protein
MISGDVELDAEPTTYTTTANMEGVVAADVYIAPAAAGTAGLVNNVAGNTVGTPILGRIDGGTVAAGYVGQEVKSTWVNISLTANTDTSMGVLTDLGKGRWIVTMCGTGDSANATDNMQISISTTNNTLDTTQHGETWIYSGRLGGNTASQVYYLSRVLDISSDTTDVYAVGRNNTGNGTAFRGSIRAIRIA